MVFQIVTLFPERYRYFLESGLPSRGLKKALLELRFRQLRHFADPKRGGRVDDLPYGGGPGMVLEVGPIHRALGSFPEKHPVVLFTPRGQRLNQKMVRSFSELPGITLVSGYFEGVDERVAEHLVDYQISIGDFVLNSGDAAALCFLESVMRLLPGFMGSSQSHIEESHETEGMLEYPQYTRPPEYQGWQVPPVLLSGDHGKIAHWRKESSDRISRGILLE
ncbi:MAG: tRNA (guanosine(37)-N1)-methyltransferase TrmD [Leptospiraceae bacterium]|nr:tRNA (guanosine(37)-N1)-methyltransferase TrmD [Leptospiraceae bacterium]MCB1305379.1 tRNA (guanosine(37)-N1)-methyltransferase TrmD [Leptospiraceae bacterium]